MSAPDQGILMVVRWLQAKGYQTTDSGDGKSKAEEIASGDALPFPHVHILVTVEGMASSAKGLASALSKIGVDPGDDFPDLSIEVSYSPYDGTAMMSLYGFDDDDLHRAYTRIRQGDAP